MTTKEKIDKLLKENVSVYGETVQVEKVFEVLEYDELVILFEDIATDMVQNGKLTI